MEIIVFIIECSQIWLVFVFPSMCIMHSLMFMQKRFIELET